MLLRTFGRTFPATLATLLFATATAAVADDGRFFVEFDRFGPEARRAVKDAGGHAVHEFSRYGVIAASLSDRARERLARHPNVRSIEVDPKRHLMSQSSPYGISMVQADLVSDASAANRKVCIIDSGYYVDHDDLPEPPNVTGVDDSGTGHWYEDGCGHGTHVAGTIAALNNTDGVLGVLPGGTVKLHVVKVFGDTCSWTYSSSLIAALDRCRGAGANVVSMSLGGSLKSRWEEAAFNDAWNAGLLSVAAAGNNGSTQKSYPASYGSVVSVGAVDSTGAVAGFSQKNDQLELCAPGVSVRSTVPWLSQESLTVGGTVYSGNHIDGSATDVSATGELVDGGLCDGGGSWGGKVVLCERGSVSFLTKVQNVETSGGDAAVIYNNEPGNFLGTLGSGASSTIPAISLSQEDGESVVATKLDLAGTVDSLYAKPASGYEEWDGTSMATPHVSGVAALVWSHLPIATNAEVRDALAASALDLGPAGKDTACGYGLVQAAAALDVLEGGAPVCTLTETLCTNGVDDDCDGPVDAADSDCAGGSCLPKGSSCSVGSDCCSGNCGGKPGRRTCK